MEPAVQQKAVRRLKIIKGQIDGLEKMIDGDKYCLEVLTQISAIHEALRCVGKVIVNNHLRTCVTDGIKKGTKKEAEQHYKELESIIYKLTK